MDRRGTLLLVEDETTLRMLVAQFLRIEGYHVVEAADGGEGLRKYQEEGPFDLLLLDLKMPVLTGVELARRVKHDDPGQKIMICSAVIVREHEAALKSVGVHHIITKPYHPESLLAHIRIELDARADRQARPLDPVLASARSV